MASLLTPASVVLFLTFFTLLESFATVPKWVRNPSISHDGSIIAFCYKGDIFVAQRLNTLTTTKQITSHTADDISPVFSRDGKSIVFASNRYGNFDIYVVSVEGGNPKRLTFHSSNEYPTDITADGATVLFTSSQQDTKESILFPSGSLSELYSVPISGGRTSLVLTTPTEACKVNTAGNFWLYQNRKGYENEWRKHHNSSIVREIFSYSPTSKKHTKLVETKVEQRDPSFYSHIGKNYFSFLSEADGTFNVWTGLLSENGSLQGEIAQRTFYKNHPVRNLSVSDAGVAIYSWDGELYTVDLGKAEEKPVKVQLEINVDSKENVQLYKMYSNGASEFEISPTEKEAAFIVRGDIFVVSLEHKTTKRITNTPEQERNVSFSPDGRKLLYSSERNSSWDIYTTTIVDTSDKFFYAASILNEEVILNSPKEEFQPLFSPDGKFIAYLEERVKIKLYNVATKSIEMILDSTHNYSYSDGDQYFSWSPDSKWLAMEYIDKKRWVGEVGLVNIETKQVHNISQSGYNDFAPRFMGNGSIFVWFSDRNGMRSHGSWGSQSDAYAIFLTDKSWEQYQLSEDEYELRKDEFDSKDKNDDDDSEDWKQKMKRKKELIKKKKFVNLVPNFENIDQRFARLTQFSSYLGDAVLTDNAEKMFYLAKFEEGYDLWVSNFKKGENKLLAKLKTTGGSLKLSSDNKTIFVLANGQIQSVNVENGTTKQHSFKAEVHLKPAKEREYIFDHVWRQTLKKFYLASMHGVDWSFYKKEYQKFLPDVVTTYDFSILLSEMLGELNASHTGCNYRPSSDPEISDVTASLGCFYDEKHTGDGYKISEVVNGSPFDIYSKEVKAGDIITHIDGELLSANIDIASLLNKKTGKRTTISYSQKGTKKQATIQPISLGEFSQLLYQRWIRNCEKTTLALSNNTVGYVHVRGMNDGSFRETFERALGRHADKQSLIVDTRFNGGGWLHDDLATFLSGKQYVTLVPRGQQIGSEPQNKWQRKSVVLMSESNYSDAHFFPYTYKALGIGTLIGMPVPGTATAVWWETLQNPELVFGIPQIGVVGTDGKYLENQELVPDIEVQISPEHAAAGKDTQLERAIEELLKK